jgi:hypothetical protein
MGRFLTPFQVFWVRSHPKLPMDLRLGMASRKFCCPPESIPDSSMKEPIEAFPGVHPKRVSGFSSNTISQFEDVDPLTILKPPDILLRSESSSPGRTQPVDLLHEFFLPPAGEPREVRQHQGLGWDIMPADGQHLTLSAHGRLLVAGCRECLVDEVMDESIALDPRHIGPNPGFPGHQFQTSPPHKGHSGTPVLPGSVGRLFPSRGPARPRASHSEGQQQCFFQRRSARRRSFPSC